VGGEGDLPCGSLWNRGPTVVPLDEGSSTCCGNLRVRTLAREEAIF
jgi:hypothetical protein